MAGRTIIFAALLSGCSAAVITDKPLTEPTVVLASPGPTYVWIDNSWDWDQRARVYVMRPGQWTEPKGKKSEWVEGRWVRAKRGWKYKNGYWRGK